MLNLIDRALHRGIGKRPEVLNHGHAQVFDRCVGQRSRSMALAKWIAASGDENAMRAKSNNCKIVSKLIWSAVSEQDGGFSIKSAKFSTLSRALKVFIRIISQFVYAFASFLCISPCLSSVMPDETNTEHLEALLEEKFRLVLE